MVKCWDRGLKRALSHLERSPQNLEDRFTGDYLCSGGLSLTVGGGQGRAEVVGVNVPQRMHDDLDGIPPAAGRDGRQHEELPLRLGREVCSSRSGRQVLPVRNSEVDWSAGIKRKARQIKHEAPAK